jgi:hypothetical protein
MLREMSAVAARYLEHLGPRDLSLLAAAARVADDQDLHEAARALRSNPRLVADALDRPGTFERLLAAGRGEEPLVEASPFLLFAAGVHRASYDLASATFVPDWVAPRRRLPVLDAARLRDFVADPRHKLFLTELLTSFVRVTSGVLWVQSRNTWRRQRYSELDPVQFAALLEVVAEHERPGIYRRLGDLALFLTGVFPDHSATNLLGRFDVARLLRSTTSGRPPADVTDELGAVALLEGLGVRWYKIACTTAPPYAGPSLEVVSSIASHFQDARRVLNYVTEQYLFRHRGHWFPGIN